MNRLQETLNVVDELNLYLVVNALKPATMVHLSSLNPALEARVTKSDELKEGVRYLTISVTSGVVDELRKYLGDIKVAYKDCEQEDVAESWDSQGNKIMHRVGHNHAFYVGSNEENLKQLLSAEEHSEKGRALGFPPESIETYLKVIDGERRDGSYVPVALAKAKRAGMELPTWIAYICFVPDEFDLVNGNISLSSQRLGETYQQFVRQNNPDLAERVEQQFLNRKLPDSWEKAPDGGYSLEWKFS